MADKKESDIILSQAADIKILLPILEKFANNPNASVNISLVGPIYVSPPTQLFPPAEQPAQLEETTLQGLHVVNDTEFQPSKKIIAEFKKILITIPVPKIDNLLKVMFGIVCKETSGTLKEVCCEIGCSEHQARYFIKRFGLRESST